MSAKRPKKKSTAQSKKKSSPAAKKEPSMEARRAMLRPANFEKPSPSQQWEIDKALGILDWDGGE